MRRPLRIDCLLCALAIAFGITTAHAEWISNGTPAGHNFTVVATDGNGGAFIGSIGGARLPTLQHLTANGDRSPGWPASGIAPRVRGGYMGSGANPDEYVRVAPDGEGGAYVSVQVDEDCQASCTGAPREVRVIRLLGTGEFAPGWPPGGVPVGYVHRSGIPTLVSNGRFGVLVCWWNWNFQLQVQALDPLGNKQWSEEGVVLNNTSVSRSLPSMVNDGSGGAFVFWMEGNAYSEGRVVAQHVSAAGTPLWPGNRFVSNVYGHLPESVHWRYWDAPSAISDGAGGAVVSWAGMRIGVSTDIDIFAARITNGGTLPWRRDLAVCTADGTQNSPQFVAGRGGQTLIAWHDRRDLERDGFFIQSLNRGGQEKWASNGIPFCSAAGIRDGLAAVDDGEGGAFFAWHDYRPEGMVYATRLTSNGTTSPEWPENGAVVCSRLPDGTVAENRPSAIAYNLGLAADGNGNAILAWSDSRNFCGYDDDRCNDRSFAMRLLPDGPATTERSAAATGAPMADGASGHIAAAAAASSELALLGSRTFPGGGCEVRFSLSTFEPARLDVFDLAGRRQLTRELGALGPGVHGISIRSTELPRGVFFVRLTQGARRTNARIVLTR